MSKSEIFDSFVKIAQEKGMINDSRDSKKKLEETGRADSLDISAIEALYGVKPDAAKGSDYKKNIMEVAHPNSVVISPSYDKLNGLVENNIERQNILLHIVNKTPDGISTQRKYAQRNLLLSLVRLGNDLDNSDQDELRVLADQCLFQASDKPLKKEAFDPLTWAAIAASAAILGGIYAKQHLRFISDGFEQDHIKLMKEIDDLLNSNTSWGVGYEYSPEFTQMVNTLKTKLDEYYNVVHEVMPIIERIQEPKDGNALAQQAKENPDPKIAQAIKAFRDATLNIWPFIQQVEADFDDESYKQRQVKNKGWLSKLVDAPQIFHGGAGLVADDFDDVKHALQTYMLDLKKINETLGNTINFAQMAAQKLQAARSAAPGANQAAKPKEPGIFERGLGTVTNMFSTPNQPAAQPKAASARSLEEKLGIDELNAQFMKLGR